MKLRKQLINKWKKSIRQQVYNRAYEQGYFDGQIDLKSQENKKC